MFRGMLRYGIDAAGSVVRIMSLPDRSAVRRWENVMSSVRETRQGIGFPDWEIVRGSARVFNWYPEGSVTELGFVGDDGREIRLAVSDYNRKVIRAEYVGGGSVWCATVAGLVRRFYGSGAYGHTEYFVAVA